MIFNLVAEGFTEEIIASRLLPFCGHELGVVYGRKGVEYIRKKAHVFHHQASAESGVLVLTDFRDSGATCVPDALQECIFSKISTVPKTFLCRFSVNEIESWLLADRETIAKFLNVSISRIPLNPENEPFPKKTLIKIARSSRSKAIYNGLAPPPGHHADVGPDYIYLVNEFIKNKWNIEAAINNSKSLERCANRLCALKSNR